MFLSADLPQNEAQRLARLRALDVLDTPPEPMFDALIEAAAAACDTPIALITLVDESRQWFKASIGLKSGITETRRELSFCAHGLLGRDDFLEIRDTRLDPRFKDNPIVTHAQGILFYAGATIALSDGTKLGALSVLDRKPRVLEPHEKDTLRRLAKATAAAFESRERANCALADANRAKTQMATLYRSTPAALFSMDTAGFVLTVSDQFLEETGYARDDLVGRCIFEILTPASADYARTIGFPRFLQTGRTNGAEYEVVHKDGRRIDVLVSQTLERDAQGMPLRSMSVFENITPRKAAERALRNEQARLARIIEGTQAGTWEYRVREDESTHSERIALMLGYPKEDLAQFTHARWRSLVHADDLPAMMAALNEHLEGRTPYYESECRIRHREGHWVWILTRAIVTERDADGAPLLLEGTRIDISRRKTMEAALRSSQSFLERVGKVAGVGGYELELRDGRINWSAEMCRMHDCEPGYSPTREEALNYFTDKTRAKIEEVIQSSIDEGTSFDLELPFVSATGRGFWARTFGSVEYENGHAVRLVGAMQDVTTRKKMENDLASHRELLQVTLDSIGDAVVTTDTDSIVQWLNPVAERLTGWTKADAVGRPLHDVFVIVDDDTRAPCENPVARCLDQSRSIDVAGQVTMIARDRSEYGIEDSASPIRDAAGNVLGAVLVFRDVSEQRRLNQEMTHRATHDHLTGLLNRSEFESRLSRLIDEIGMEPSPNALLYIDLDQFKLVNDACGHAAGDELLRQVTRILRTSVRAHDTLVRLGGDEFGVLLEHCEMQHAERVAQKICDQMDAFRFVHDDGRRFRVGASIGLVPVDERWSNSKTLMQAADAACFAAKDGGRNRVHAWAEADQTATSRHGDMQWVSRMELALDENRFELFGQRIDPIDGREAGLHFEVLLRLREANGTLVMPGAFLPAAERFHMANRLDRWVVRKAFEWLRYTTVERIDVGMMSINLSGQSLGDRAFHRDIVDMLRSARFDVRRVCFEVTETAAITHLADARTFIEEVRSFGVKVALDDFGAGASSFGYLKSLPVDFLKIDGHFITNLLEDALDNAAVRCFCDVAKVVGVKTIAEFVERQDVRDALREIGVDMAQGYLVHKPEPLASLLADRFVKVA